MLGAALLAFTVTVAVCPVVIGVLRRLEVLDRPCARSSHEAPTPRGAGIAVAAGALAALWLAAAPESSNWWIPLVATSAAFGVLGLVEDVRGVPAVQRLVVQAVMAAASVPMLVSDVTGPAVWRLLFTVGVLLWLVSYVNAFNFMDGINGIAAVQAVTAGGLWCALGVSEGITQLAFGGAIICGAGCGFVPYNYPRAKAFLGDTGSYFLGAWLAVLVVVGLREGLPPEAVLAPLALALVDTLSALVRRVRRGDVWHEPHREHVYQRLVAAGWSQTSTTLFVGGLLLACSCLGAVTLATGLFAVRVAADLALAALLAAYLWSPHVAAALVRPSPAPAVQDL